MLRVKWTVLCEKVVQIAWESVRDCAAKWYQKVISRCASWSLSADDGCCGYGRLALFRGCLILFLCVGAQHFCPNLIAFFRQMQTVGAVGGFQFRRSGFHHVGVDVDKGEAFCLAIGFQQAVDGGDIVGFSVERFPTLKVFIDGQETLNVERGLRGLPAKGLDELRYVVENLLR